MQALPKTPFPVTFRELWLPPAINGLLLPNSVEGGHLLTLTGAKLGSTVDGVHFDGSATSNINAGAIHNAAAKLVLSFRLKLDQNHAAGAAAHQYIWGKFLGVDDYIQLYLHSVSGKLIAFHRGGAADLFVLLSAETSWNAGQWYNVLLSTGQAIGGGAASNGARLRIDNGVAMTSADVTALPNGGDFVIGDSDDPGGGTGCKAVMADFFVMTDDVTDAEEADLYKGIPPPDAVNFWPLREGRGVTAYDRGSGGNNGTLDTSCKWKFGQVEQPILDLDGINDHGQSSAGVDINGDSTLVWVGKMKSSYNALVASHELVRIRVDDNNLIKLHYFHTDDGIRWYAIGGGTTQDVDFTTRPSIDDYLVLIGTLTQAGVLRLFANGTLVGEISGVGVISELAATAYLGAMQTPAEYDISPPLIVALTDGAFTAKQAQAFSRWLKDIYNLPISV